VIAAAAGNFSILFCCIIKYILIPIKLHSTSISGDFLKNLSFFVCQLSRKNVEVAHFFIGSLHLF